MREVIFITPHAIARFRERIHPGITDAEVGLEMVRCLATAKDKHFSSKNLRCRTHYIPTDRCIMICSWGRIMTVIERKTTIAPTHTK